MQVPKNIGSCPSQGSCHTGTGPSLGKLAVIASGSHKICHFMMQAILLHTTKTPTVRVLRLPIQKKADGYSARENGETMRC